MRAPFPLCFDIIYLAFWALPSQFLIVISTMYSSFCTLTILVFAVAGHAFLLSYSGVLCDGPLPPFAFSRPPLPPGQSLTLQQICANSDQGGVDGYTPQGYCARRYILPSINTLFKPWVEQWEFRVATAALEPHNGLLRLSQYCMLRCVCNTPPRLRAPLPYSDWIDPNDVASYAPWDAYQINVPDLGDLHPDHVEGQEGGKWLSLATYRDPTRICTLMLLGTIATFARHFGSRPSTGSLAQGPCQHSPCQTEKTQRISAMISNDYALYLWASGTTQLVQAPTVARSTMRKQISISPTK